MITGCLASFTLFRKRTETRSRKKPVVFIQLWTIFELEYTNEHVVLPKKYSITHFAACGSYQSQRNFGGGATWRIVLRETRNFASSAMLPVRTQELQNRLLKNKLSPFAIPNEDDQLEFTEPDLDKRSSCISESLNQYSKKTIVRVFDMRKTEKIHSFRKTLHPLMEKPRQSGLNTFKNLVELSETFEKIKIRYALLQI